MASSMQGIKGNEKLVLFTKVSAPIRSCIACSYWFHRKITITPNGCSYTYCDIGQTFITILISTNSRCMCYNKVTTKSLCLILSFGDSTSVPSYTKKTELGYWLFTVIFL